METKAMSLLKFNERVLSQGYISTSDDEISSFNDLKQSLFFNRVFISNIREMFQKGNVDINDKDFYCALYRTIADYETAIADIKYYFNNYMEDVKWEEEIPIEAELQVEKVIREQMIVYPTNRDEIISHLCKTGLYFICRDDKDYYVIEIDSNHSILKNLICINHGDCRKYIPTINTISKWNSNWYDEQFPIYVTCNEHGKVTLIESMDKLPDWFSKSLPSNIFKVIDTFFTDDLNDVINNYIERKVEEVSNFTPTDINDVWDKDILIEYPKDTFNEFLQFISQTIRDDIYVSDLYITLYRIGDDPAIFNILTKAVEHGVRVHANIELCASGEFINQFWLVKLRNAGVDVHAYQCGHLKVHAKLALIKYKHGRMICHIGTGNYHTKTTAQYTDLSLMTSDKEICKCVSNLFEIMMTDSLAPLKTNDSLLVTQYNCRDRLNAFIHNEGKKGANGLIVIKCNSIDDKMIIKELQKAADKGCQIILIVRGLCTIQASKNITIKSIIWDKLEHSRVYAFGSVDPIIYIGSLDLVTNKLDKRIEAMVKIKNPEIVMSLMNYLNRYIMSSDGSWYQDTNGNYKMIEG